MTNLGYTDRYILENTEKAITLGNHKFLKENLLSFTPDHLLNTCYESDTADTKMDKWVPSLPSRSFSSCGKLHINNCSGSFSSVKLPKWRPMTSNVF